MINITVKREGDNRHEYGYGVYVNAYVQWQDDMCAPVLYASECVPFGQNTEENLKAAEERVRKEAEAIAKKEWIGE